MNYGAAKERARHFVNNRTDIDFDHLQPLVIADLNVGLDVQENEGVKSLVPTPSSFADISVADLPADFGRIKQVKGNKRNLDPTDIQTLLDHAGLRFDQYAISGMQIWVQTSFALALVYSKRIAELVGDLDSNAILDRYSTLYIYGLARHANLQIQDFDAAATYESAFVSALELANINNVMATFSAGLAPTSPYAS